MCDAETAAVARQLRLAVAVAIDSAAAAGLPAGGSYSEGAHIL